MILLCAIVAVNFVITLFLISKISHVLLTIDLQAEINKKVVIVLEMMEKRLP